MPKSVLVGYSTVYGSTQEVAEFIAGALQSNRVMADLQPVRKVKSLEGYQAVVLGAPLYMFRWHKDALHFLSRYRKDLEKMPVAVFALGPFHNKEDEMESARTQLNKALLGSPWLKPTRIEVFPGKFDPALLRFPYSLIGPLKKMPASDERDWEVIRDWVNHIIPTFEPENE